ncbi:MAG: hypothetical protein R6U68_14405 [Desulfobacteraceae bacterium]
MCGICGLAQSSGDQERRDFPHHPAVRHPGISGGRVDRQPHRCAAGGVFVLHDRDDVFVPGEGEKTCVTQYLPGDILRLFSLMLLHYTMFFSILAITDIEQVT